jgi:hypothetical protein
MDTNTRESKPIHRCYQELCILRFFVVNFVLDRVGSRPTLKRPAAKIIDSWLTALRYLAVNTLASYQ